MKYVKAQIEGNLEPVVTSDTMHLRTLLVIFSILRYPREHWLADKDLIK